MGEKFALLLVKKGMFWRVLKFESVELMEGSLEPRQPAKKSRARSFHVNNPIVT